MYTNCITYSHAYYQTTNQPYSPTLDRITFCRHSLFVFITTELGQCLSRTNIVRNNDRNFPPCVIPPFKSRSNFVERENLTRVSPRCIWQSVVFVLAVNYAWLRVCSRTLSRREWFAEEGCKKVLAVYRGRHFTGTEKMYFNCIYLVLLLWKFSDKTHALNIYEFHWKYFSETLFKDNLITDAFLKWWKQLFLEEFYFFIKNDIL